MIHKLNKGLVKISRKRTEKHVRDIFKISKEAYSRDPALPNSCGPANCSILTLVYA